MFAVSKNQNVHNFGGLHIIDQNQILAKIEILNIRENKWAV